VTVTFSRLTTVVHIGARFAAQDAAIVAAYVVRAVLSGTVPEYLTKYRLMTSRSTPYVYFRAIRRT